MKISPSVINYINAMIKNQPNLSSRQIAKFARVSEYFVAKYRKSLLTTNSNPISNDQTAIEEQQNERCD